MSESSEVDAPEPEGPAELTNPTQPRKRWHARARNWVVDQIQTPDPEDDHFRRFPTDEKELAAALATEDPDRSAGILAEAKDFADRSVESRVDSAERRAATLQSATAIAGSFSLAGGGLVATDIDSYGWQIAIGVLLLWVVLNLGLCGWRATQASSKVLRWSREPAKDILKRSDQTVAAANVDRATQTLLSADWNGRYARWKVDMLGRAGKHLVRASLGLPLILAVVLAYVIAHPHSQSTTKHADGQGIARIHAPRLTVAPSTRAHRPGSSVHRRR